MQVYDKGTWLASYKDVPKGRKSVALASMFPSGRSFQDLVDSNHNIEMKNDINISISENSEDGVQAAENSLVQEVTEEVSDFPLERCMRIVPHDQNTGAFFIAVLQKVSPLPGNFTYDLLFLFLSLSLLNFVKYSQGIMVNKLNLSSVK